MAGAPRPRKKARPAALTAWPWSVDCGFQALRVKTLIGVSWAETCEMTAAPMTAAEVEKRILEFASRECLEGWGEKRRGQRRALDKIYISCSVRPTVTMHRGADPVRRGKMETPTYRSSVWNKRPALGRLKLRKQPVTSAVDRK